MTERVKVEADEIQVGEPLPWAVFDQGGRLLLQEGVVIATGKQLAVLLEKGLYRTREVIAPPPVMQDFSAASPFELIGIYKAQLQSLLSGISGGRAEQASKDVDMIANAILALDADAALLAMHIGRRGPYSTEHLFYSAVVVNLIARRLCVTESERKTFVAAALVSNVGMIHIQDKLAHHKSALTQEQRTKIHRHPELGVRMLESAGINDDALLQLVLQHHERADGSGYPRKLSGDEVLLGARIIGLVDRYDAMLCGRSNRKALPPLEAIKSLYLRRGSEVDGELVQVFIREIGLYPPGVAVRLANGETGIVVQRLVKAGSGKVLSFISPRGAWLDEPVIRECKHSSYHIQAPAEVEQAFGFDEIVAALAYKIQRR